MQLLKTLFHSQSIFGVIIAKEGSSSQILVFNMWKALLRRRRGEDVEEEAEVEDEVEEEKNSDVKR